MIYRAKLHYFSVIYNVTLLDGHWNVVCFYSIEADIQPPRAFSSPSIMMMPNRWYTDNISKTV